MISWEIKDKICRLIAEIEQDKQVRIFYACESGSRAWGFPSVDSDQELTWGPKIPAISNFLATEIERLESERFDKRKHKPDVEKLNGLFRSALKEVWEITWEF